MEISIKEVSKRYKANKFGLKNFSIELENGVVGLIGPNGAGKSTLMRILATISKPTEGQVSLNGSDIVKFPNKVRKILGYLPQDFGVYPNLTAVEFLKYIGAIKGFSGKSLKIRIEGLLDILNLSTVKNRPIGTYSGGMKQRIGIAQVLLGDPKLLILDEPTVGLDPEERVRFRNLLSDLSGDRIVILSSHIVSDIETIANDIAIIFAGSLLEHQLPETILKSIDNQVFEGTIPGEEFESFRTNHLISNSMRKSGGWLARFVLDSGEKLPDFPIQPVKGTLEDAYLSIISSAKKEEYHDV